MSVSRDELMTAMKTAAREIDETLDLILPKPVGPEGRLFEAMRYAVLGGGKRLRPFLALQCGHLFDVEVRAMRQVAAAIECVHTYSLVHDDLPAMDDDDLRRGRPSTHKEFDEATAILAGDALLTLGFGLLSRPDASPDPWVRCELVSRLAAAAGGRGMVGGQMMDLLSDSFDHTIGAITRLQRLKTGALFAFSCEAAGVMAKAGQDVMHVLNAYAHDLGLAFQIADDLLDYRGSAETMGKTPQKDAAAGKATFVEILGPERAEEQAQHLAAQAEAHLDMFGDRANLLRAAARFVIDRDL